MDPVRNPYTPGAGSRPPALTGREREIERVTVLLERVRAQRPEKSLMVTGLRGVGKTVLLGRFGDIAESMGIRTASAEVTHETEFASMMARLTRRLVLSMDPMERAKDRAWQAAAVLKAFSLKLPHGYQIGIDVDAVRGRADSGNLNEDLGDLLVAVGEAALERGTGIVFLLDEIQFLDRAELEALITAIHRVAQRSLPLTVIGAGLPQIPVLAGEAKSYAERLFDFPEIGRLTLEAAREAIERPAEEQGIELESGAVEGIVSYTEGYPYFLQEYGKHVWNLAAGDRISVDDVERARPIVQEQLDLNFFKVRVGRVTKSELRYIVAMASLGRGPYRTGDIAAKLGKPSTSIAPLRSQLINKGLIYSPTYGLNDFTVPQFDEFLRRNFAADATGGVGQAGRLL